MKITFDSELTEEEKKSIVICLAIVLSMVPFFLSIIFLDQVGNPYSWLCIPIGFMPIVSIMLLIGADLWLFGEEKPK